MLFKVDADRMLLLFSVDARDLALAFAELEGFAVTKWSGTTSRGGVSSVLGPRWNQRPGCGAIEPRQETPGLWAYRIARKKRPRGCTMAP